MTDKQYLDIKDFILNLFRDKNSFELDADYFYNKFELTHPYFQELKQRLSQDNNPFYIKAIGYIGDADKDPIENILFYKK